MCHLMSQRFYFVESDDVASHTVEFSFVGWDDVAPDSAMPSFLESDDGPAHVAPYFAKTDVATHAAHLHFAEYNDMVPGRCRLSSQKQMT